MRKRLELTHEQSCFNRANMEETLFVLLARDKAAPATIRFWVEERIRIGKNKREDEVIKEALICAKQMEEDQKWVC